jgi:2,3-bisphosphoglycerate-dependent phosphoglycerate mutase
MVHLVIFRHGQSVWNLENKFTGWVDVELSSKGIEEAKSAGIKLKGYKFDEGYTSVLKRARITLEIALKECEMDKIHVTSNAALNERMYGDLQGLNKSETAAKFGEDQVRIWRRSFDIAPPGGESLKDTAARVIPYFESEIAPKLKSGKNIVLAAHGNSLRALIMHLEKMTPDQILEFEIGTAVPRVYELDENLEIISVKNL